MSDEHDLSKQTLDRWQYGRERSLEKQIESLQTKNQELELIIAGLHTALSNVQGECKLLRDSLLEAARIINECDKQVCSEDLSEAANKYREIAKD
jgi:chromosome segregation ATPase